MKRKQDKVIIVGAGPAGISAGLWCERLQLPALLLEARDEAGGQLNEIHAPLTDYLGMPVEDPTELRDSFVEHAGAWGVQVRYGATTRSLKTDTLRLGLANDEIMQARALIIATGTTRRELGLIREQELSGKGLYWNLSRGLQHVGGKRVAVVGSGDTACQTATQLADAGASEVLLIIRGGEPSARPYFAEPALQNPRIHLLLHTRVEALLGQDRLTGIVIRTQGQQEQLQLDELHGRVGRIPDTDWLGGAVRVDEDGFIRVDRHGCTNLDLVYAVGDIAAPHAPSVSWATGSAMAAAKHLEKRLRLGRPA